jgi:hypothetical protein
VIYGTQQNQDMDTNYIIFDVSELNLIDYNQVIEHSPETLRYSIDGTKTFIKWIGNDPDFISALVSKSVIYNNEDMMNILHTDEWEHKLVY